MDDNVGINIQDDHALVFDQAEYEMIFPRASSAESLPGPELRPQVLIYGVLGVLQYRLQLITTTDSGQCSHRRDQRVLPVRRLGVRRARDYQNRFVLTVLPKNRGNILGNDTDEAQVIIQVQDGK